MSPFQQLFIRTLQAFFVSALLLMLGLSLIRLIGPDPTAYVELRTCRQINPWENRCITQKLRVDAFNKYNEDATGERGEGP